MRRREFVTLIGGMILAWPRTTRAQQAERTRRVGVLLPATEDETEEQRRVMAFVEGLRGLGWQEGRNIQIDVRWAGTDPGRIRSAAANLVEVKPDVLLTESALGLAPLQQLTKTIPIIFLQIADPVANGFVASLARPGGNITGFSPAEFSVSGKLLELLKEVAPQVSRVDVIYNPVQAPQLGMLGAIEKAAPPLGVQVNAASARNADEIAQIFGSFDDRPGGGVIVLPNPVNTINRSLIISLAARHNVPAIYAFSFFVRDGGLVSYGSDPAVQFRQAASYMDRILKGAHPTDLPVQQPTKFYLAINLKTAKALGLTIPRDFLLVADEVIE